MGEAINKISFTDNDFNLFSQRLREETLLLKKMFETRAFEYLEHPVLGLEVEAWLVDKNSIPNPINKTFLKECNDSDVVEELSKFNFELNTPPLVLQKSCFYNLKKQLETTWSRCTKACDKLDSTPVLIGIHPLIRNEMLQPQFMSEGKRYKALNDQVLSSRQGKPIELDIEGSDHFKLKLDHILIEAAATSIQVHIQANQENIGRAYNASQIAAIPCVAIAANSPYLYGHELWQESRIPLFEQAVQLKSFRDKKGIGIGRVTFGTGYVRHSMLELFLENLNGYPPLIPTLFDDKPELLHHLRFHNGTLWRWNRPIIGMNSKGQSHIRIEQRAMASGPTLIDIVANVAFSTGLTLYFANLEKAPEESMTFTDCRNNFYAAAKEGLGAKVRWFGQEIRLDQLILEDLIPKAKKGLSAMGIDKDEIDYFISEVIQQRVLSGQNGARWQKSFINLHGKDFQALAKEYQEQQMTGAPVHQWKI